MKIITKVFLLSLITAAIVFSACSQKVKNNLEANNNKGTIEVLAGANGASEANRPKPNIVYFVSR